MHAIHVVVLFSVRKSALLHKEDIDKQLMKFISSARKAPGCIGCTLLKSTEDPSEYCLSEAWESKEAHEAHMESTHFKSFAPFIAKHMYSLAPRILQEVA